MFRKEKVLLEFVVVVKIRMLFLLSNEIDILDLIIGCDKLFKIILFMEFVRFVNIKFVIVVVLDCIKVFVVFVLNFNKFIVIVYEFGVKLLIW